MKFKLDENNKCLIATPVKHLELVSSFLEENKNCFLIDEKANKNDILNNFLNEPKLKYLFVNPNAQGYKLDSEILSKINLKGINTCSTGTNHIDLDYCNKQKILVKSLKTDFDLINNLPSTSELAFCLMQSLFRKTIICHNQVVENADWNYTNVMGNQLSGKTIGCLGYGRLGKIFCEQLRGFSVKIKVCEKRDIPIPSEYEKCSINDLFCKCDAVAIHIHSCLENMNLINKEFLQSTKKGFILVNTSREFM